MYNITQENFVIYVGHHVSIGRQNLLENGPLGEKRNEHKRMILTRVIIQYALRTRDE